MASKNYYEILEVSKDATTEDIKKAYRRLAHKYHPDKNKDENLAEQKMKEINFIYSVLSNPLKRRSYDATLGAKEYFDNFDWSYDSKQSRIDIYCDELDVMDSTGRNTKIKVGQNIYYQVEIDRSIITWTYKRKEYFDLYVKKIFDPNKKDSFSKVLNYDFKKEPLCLVYFGGQDLIIYKDDFRSFWLSEESYKNIDLRKGLITAGIMSGIVIVGIYYLFVSHPITSNQRETIQNELSVSTSDQEFRNSLKNYYKATSGEINYIETGRYETCSFEDTTTTADVEINSAPDFYALSDGQLPKGSGVEILLYYKGGDAYKINSDDAKISGWVSAKFLDNPICDTVNQ